MAWTLEEAQEHLLAWLDANKALATGQNYRLGDSYLTRADASAVKERITFWRNEVIRLSSGRGPGARTFRGVLLG